MQEGFLYTDGGSRGNPGPAAAGMVLKDDSQNVVKRAGKYLGIKTNNEAEYEALILGMKISHKAGIDKLTCVLDSELIVKQLTGVYKIKSENLKDLVEEIKNLETKFNSIKYRHVRRENNQEADELVNKVLDSRK